MPFLRSFKTLVQISTSTEVNHFTSKKLNIRRKIFLGNFGCINENRLSLRRRHFFHPYDLVLTSKPSKTSKFYHFNVLKCNFCFIINSWQKFKSSISVFKPSQCCRGAIYCLSLTSEQTIIMDL